MMSEIGNKVFVKTQMYLLLIVSYNDGPVQCAIDHWICEVHQMKLFEFLRTAARF